MTYKVHKKVGSSLKENDLPDSIDISEELSQLEALDAQKAKISDLIEAKLQDTVTAYCDRGEFLQAKEFLGRCFGSQTPVTKVLLFKYIVTREKES